MCLQAYVPSGLCALCAFRLMCLMCLQAYVPYVPSGLCALCAFRLMYHMCLQAYVPSGFSNKRSSTWLVYHTPSILINLNIKTLSMETNTKLNGNILGYKESPLQQRTVSSRVCQAGSGCHCTVGVIGPPSGHKALLVTVCNTPTTSRSNPTLSSDSSCKSRLNTTSNATRRCFPLWKWTPQRPQRHLCLWRS